MAELGDIRAVNPNEGRVPVDTRGLERGITQALGLIEKTHTEGELRKAGAQIEQDIQDAVDDVSAVHVGKPIPKKDEFLSPEIESLQRRIVDLQQDVVNGNTDHAGRARLAINQTLTELRKLDPDLADQISARVQGIVAVSPAIQELGLVDAINTANATSARKELLAMRTKATKRWSEGGLGMAFDSDFSDPRVLREYKEKIGHRVVVETAKMEAAVRIASGSADVKDLLNLTNELLVGKASGFQNMLKERQDLVRGYYDEVQKPSAEQNAAVIDGFKAQLEALTFENEQEKFGMQQAFDIVWDTINKRSQPEYAVAKAMLDDRLAMLDAQSLGMSSIQPEPYYTLQESAIKSEAWGLRHDNPAFNKFLQWQATDPNGLIWQMIKASPTGANTEAANLISTQGVEFAKQFWAYKTPSDEGSGLFLNGLRGQVTPNLTPDQISALFLNQQRQGPYPVDARTETETDEIQVGMSRLGSYRVKFNQMLAIPEWGEPGTAAKVMLPATGMFVMYNTIGNPSGDQTDDALDFLADEAILNGIRLVGDGEFKNIRFTFAKEAKNFLADDNRAYGRARREAQTAWTESTLGRVLSDFVDVQFFSDDSDNLQIDVNEATVAEAVFNASLSATARVTGNPPPFAQWLKRNQSLVDNTTRRIQTAAQRIVDFANKDIRATAHLQFANSMAVAKENDPSYRAMADRTGWLDILGGQ